MRDRQMFEYPEKMCEYCCNFDKEHIGMDGTALCKLTMTLAYAEDYGGNCMFYNVPKEKIIVPPVVIGQTVWVYNQTTNNIYRNTVIGIKIFGTGKNANKIIVKYVNQRGETSDRKFAWSQIGKQVFLSEEEAVQALAERSKE